MLPYIWELIDSHSNKRSFMRAVAKIWGLHSFEYLMIRIAYDMMFNGHRGDVRVSGERYTRHTLGVAVIIMLYLEIRDYEIVIAALLHDLHEDHPRQYPLWVFEHVFGPRVSWIIRSVTKPPYRRYGGKTPSHAEAAKNKVLRGGFASIVVKLADRLHNAMTLWGSAEKKLNKLRETKDHYYPMAVQHRILVTELFVAVSHQWLSPHLYVDGSSEIGRNGD